MFPLKRSEKWRERRRMKDEKRASGRKLSKWKYNVTADERYRHEHDLETESVLYTTKWLDDLSGLWPSFFFQTFHSQIVLMGLLSAPAALICIQPHWLGPPTKFPLPRTEWKKVLYPLLQPCVRSILTKIGRQGPHPSSPIEKLFIAIEWKKGRALNP